MLEGKNKELVAVELPPIVAMAESTTTAEEIKKIRTFRYRIKDSTHDNYLNSLSRKVNFVWNYCNEMSDRARRDYWLGNNPTITDDGKQKYIHNFNKKRGFLDAMDFNWLLKGVSKELELPQYTVNMIVHEHHKKRKQAKKRALKFRGRKNTGFIPFAFGYQISKFDNQKGVFIFNKRIFKLFYHRPLPKNATPKQGSFVQNKQGHWFWNVQCEMGLLPLAMVSDNARAWGIDPGLKSFLTRSDGHVEPTMGFANTDEADEKLKKLQWARKEKQIKKFYDHLAQKRKHWHYDIANRFIKDATEQGVKAIFMGDVSPKNLMKRVKGRGAAQRSGMARQWADESLFQFKTILKYKCEEAGILYQEVSERKSSKTCSQCFAETGPTGQAELRIREWVCKACGAQHDRDVNGAKNILRFGLAEWQKDKKIEKEKQKEKKQLKSRLTKK